MPDARPGHALYPERYVWFVLLSSLDVFFTWIVLSHGGHEANPIAATVMGLHPKALVYFKFVIVVIVILICEVVGRRSARTGEWLITAACIVTCIPVLVALLQML